MLICAIKVCRNYKGRLKTNKQVTYHRSNKLTPKEISRNRPALRKLMNFPLGLGYSLCENDLLNKENENPQLINIKKTTYKIHDREIKDENLSNPFAIPDRNKVFIKSKVKRRVKPVPFIMDEVHTIRDIDHSYFKEIEGRPLREFTDVKVYMRNIRDITLFKANAAYRKDQIIQIENSQVFELEEYNKINAFYEKTKANFVKFAKESYENAKAIQKTAEIKALEVATIQDQLEAFSFEYVKLRNQVSNIMHSFETLARYGKFLNFLSPDWWKAEYDFLKTRQSDIAVTSAASLDGFKANMAILIKMKPYLYFESPIQIMNIYDDIGRQCLNYMKIEDLSANIVKTVLKSCDFFKNAFKTEVDELEDFIKVYEDNLNFMEQREMDYKAVFEKVLYSEFQTLYSSLDVTKLYTCVQYVYIRIYGGMEDPKDSVLIMMHGLEMQYMELNSSLDCLDLKIVNAATRQMFAEDNKIMKLAHIAERTLKECRILRKAVYTSLEPARQRKIVKVTAKTSKEEITK